jgi:hypothetical protein
MSDSDGKFPCSICEAAFANPRDLGTHILTDHCNNEDSSLQPDSRSPSPPPAAANPSLNGCSTIIEAHLDPCKSIIMAVDPLEHEDMSETESSAASPGSVSLTNLPREPTSDEQRQKFMVTSAAASPSEAPSSRYICLVCGKAYTSRYNIRCHLNMHSGQVL